MSLLAAPASAQRRASRAGAERSKAALRAKASRAKTSRARSRRPASAMPKRLGEGFFSRAYRSRDGKWVIKKLRPAIAGVKAISARRRAQLARITVDGIADLRTAGLPVPETYIPDGKSGVLVQRMATGIPFSQLQGKAKFEASKNLMKLFAAGRRVAKGSAGDAWYIDENRENVLFHPDGRVKVWFDPVVPTRGNEVRQVQRLLERRRAATP